MDTRKPLRKSDIVSQKIGDECMLYDPSTGSMHVINSTAEFVFNLCDGTKNLGEIEHLMQKTHQISEKHHVRKDLEAILKSFSDLGIIQP